MTVDLLAEITDICFAGCDSESIVRLSVQPINQVLHPFEVAYPSRCTVRMVPHTPF